MTRWFVPSLLLLASTGCTAILGLGDITFHGDDAGSDAGPADAAAPHDAGPDAPCENTFYRDGDGDGYGDPDRPMTACTAPADHVANADDCDDGDMMIAPGEDEVCDGVDQDCDGTLDEGLMGPVGDVIPVVDVVIPDLLPPKSARAGGWPDALEARWNRA